MLEKAFDWLSNEEGNAIHFIWLKGRLHNTYCKEPYNTQWKESSSNVFRYFIIVVAIIIMINSIL